MIPPNIDDYEPYIEDDGRVGFTIANPGSIEVKSLTEWKAEDEKLGAVLEQRAKTLFKIFPFADKPLTDDDDETLHTDLVRLFAESIWFQDERFYSVIANVIICSYIRDQLTTATRPIFYAPTKTGKSRTLECLANLCYRGMLVIDPTGASLFRLIEKYHLTICIDELQKLEGPKKSDVDLIIKGGFADGPGVPRCNEKGEVEFFKVYGSMILGSKRQPTEEDVLNRGLLICMMQKPSNAVLKDAPIRRRLDHKGMAALRGRLLAFRLRVLSGEIDLTPFIEKADKLAEEPIIIDGKEILLDDRSIDKVSELLVPGLIFKDYDSTLELLAQSENDANAGLLETLEARVFYAFQAVYSPAIYKTERERIDQVDKLRDVTTISTRDVADQLTTDLNMMGEQDDPPNTQTVGRILRLLGFRFRSGRGRASMFVSEGFDKTYAANLRKYGYRKGDDVEK